MTDAVVRSPSGKVGVNVAGRHRAGTIVKHLGLIAIMLTVAGPTRAGAKPVRHRAVAAAEPAPAPPLAVVAPGLHGFRSATFGMTRAQVLAAITMDFGVGVRTSEMANAIEGTQILQAPLSSLEPGPGAAVVSYIFGASSKRLANVNVLWSLQGEPTAEQRAAIVTAGLQLAAYFQSSLTPVKVSGLTPTGPASLVFYAAIDERGAGVQVDASGVNPRAAVDSQNAAAQPRGPATLRVSYTLNAGTPDVYRIRRGAF